ncbi:MAG TPA: hypothetical protein VF622_05075 [Segetibacter sp.]|jgi:hypothetical protein
MKKAAKLNEYFHLSVAVIGVVAVAFTFYSIVSGFTLNGNFEQFMNTLRIVIYSFTTLMSFRVYRRLRNHGRQGKVEYHSQKEEI